jgi:glycosyltransferase involved in cell wall biosynthesis
MDEHIEISIVVPVFNEGGNIDAFLDRLEPAISAIEPNHEILVIDDGSTDDSYGRLLDRCRRNTRLRVVSLSRNYGKEAALTAGFDYCRGRAAVSMDSDLQHPPEMLGTLIAKWREGNEVVYTYRESRADDPWIRGVCSRAFYRLYNRLVDVRIPPDASDFRLLDRKAIDALRQLREQTRFMKGLFSWVGFRQAGIPYTPAARHSGQTTWSFWRLWNFAVDGITSFGTLPLRVWLYIGTFISALSFVYASFLVLRTIVMGIDVPGFASIVVLILFFGGVQLVTLGIIGEYLGRVYQEVKNRPLYIVRDRMNF